MQRVVANFTGTDVSSFMDMTCSICDEMATPGRRLSLSVGVVAEQSSDTAAESLRHRAAGRSLEVSTHCNTPCSAN